MVRRSEERSDEESLFLLAIMQEGFLASLQRELSARALGMTAYGAFFPQADKTRLGIQPIMALLFALAGLIV